MRYFTIFLIALWVFSVGNTVIFDREMFWICFKQDLHFGKTLVIIWLLVWATTKLVELLG